MHVNTLLSLHRTALTKRKRYPQRMINAQRRSIGHRVERSQYLHILHDHMQSIESHMDHLHSQIVRLVDDH